MALKKCKECGNDVSTEAAACPKCGAVIKKKSGFLRFFGGTVLVFITLIAVGALINGVFNTKTSTPTPAQRSTEQIAADEKLVKERYENCKAKLEKSKENEMLYDLSAKGASIKALVGPTYFSVSIDTKEGFAKTVNCFLVNGTGGGIPFELIHWETGKKVASWNGYRLDVE